MGTSFIDLFRERGCDFVGVSISSSSEITAVVYLAVFERSFLGVYGFGVPLGGALLRVRTNGDSVDELVLFRFILGVIQPPNGVRDDPGWMLIHGAIAAD